MLRSLPVVNEVLERGKELNQMPLNHRSLLVQQSVEDYEVLVQTHERRIDCAVDLRREPDAVIVDVIDQLLEVGPDLHLNVHAFNIPCFLGLAMMILGLC